MRNIAVIDLVQLKKNALNVKEKLSKGVKFCAVVKANAYGHGAVEVASALYNIVDSFAVAIVEEGIALRNAGIDKEILVLIPTMKKDLENAVRYNLSVTVDSFLGLKQVYKECLLQKKTVKIHIAFNVGMNRFGFDNLEELEKALAFLKDKKQIFLEGFYSHLKCPENLSDLEQSLTKFLVAKKLIKSYNNKVTCHISASGGFLQGQYQDMVRIGILLYGYYPFKYDGKSFVKPIMKVYSNVVKRRKLKKGDGLLYGNFSLKQDADIALVRCGYADGLPRKKSTLFVNNRCMDVTAIIDKKFKSAVAVMSDAELFANDNQTISYEILVNATRRAEKIYIR